MEYKLSLVIPFYNSESFILDTLERISDWVVGLEYSVQVILVNDGSGDQSLSIVQDYLITMNPGFHLTSYDTNKGKGYAVRKGMSEAIGTYRIFTDADIPFGFKEIDNMVYYLDFKEFDVCIGNRKSVRSKYFVDVSFPRRIASAIFTMIISRYVVTGVNDTQCGFKGFRANVADRIFPKLRVNGFAFDVELLYLCYKYEYDIKRIPVSFEGNQISTVSLTRNSFQMLWDIFCLPFRYHMTKAYKQANVADE